MTPSAGSLNPPIVTLPAALRRGSYRAQPTQLGTVQIANALTIDLEDWPIAVLGPQHDITTRVVDNTRQCLALLRRHGVTATFFVLGKVAEQFPDLICEVARQGHEIASHGYGHELLFNITPAQFEADVARSIDVLTGIVGRRPLGYRAPAFSIVESTRWAGQILAGLGFEYDSSIFPIRHRRYGIADATRQIHRWPDCDLVECPPAAVSLMGGNWPVAGGGWFRLLPGAVVRSAVRRINAEGMPAVLYMHPYELDTDGIGAHRAAGVQFTPLRGFTQGLFRRRIEGRLDRMLSEFSFTAMSALVRQWRSRRCHDAGPSLRFTR